MTHPIVYPSGFDRIISATPIVPPAARLVDADDRLPEILPDLFPDPAGDDIGRRSGGKLDDQRDGPRGIFIRRRRRRKRKDDSDEKDSQDFCLSRFHFVPPYESFELPVNQPAIEFLQFGTYSSGLPSWQTWPPPSSIYSPRVPAPARPSLRKPFPGYDVLQNHLRVDTGRVFGPLSGELNLIPGNFLSHPAQNHHHVVSQAKPQTQQHQLHRSKSRVFSSCLVRPILVTRWRPIPKPLPTGFLPHSYNGFHYAHLAPFQEKFLPV